MTPTVYGDGAVYLYHGECIEVMRAFPDASIDAIVTDPPYGLGFMGKDWDDLPPGEDWARECLRVLKPGGHLLAFGGTRTWHRLAVAVEDAGFELRDSIAWLYGSGFPKSLDVSKAIDKTAGAEREVTGTRMGDVGIQGGNFANATQRGVIEQRDKPATPEAAKWQGWGTALKPAFEPIVVARKPLVGTVAANVLAHGTGALNIDGCRIAYVSEADAAQAAVPQPTFGVKGEGEGTYNYRAGEGRSGAIHDVSKGRWPANVVLDEDTAAVLDEQSGTLKSVANPTRRGADGDRNVLGEFAGQDDVTPARGADSGGASRFFYCAKAPTKERPKVNGVAHATVKPLALMRWLLKLVTPPGGVVLEPFAGSGTTLEAAVLEDIRIVGIEREAEYLPLIEARMERVGLVEPGQVAA